MNKPLLSIILFSFLLIGLFSGMASAVKLNDVLICSTTPPTESGTQQITDDTYVREDSATTNYGNITALSIKSESSQNQISFISYNFSNITEKPLEIYLSIYFINKVNTNNAYSLKAYYCNAEFEETAITWNNKASVTTNCNATAFFSRTMGNYTTSKRYNITLSNQFLDDADRKATIMLNITPVNAATARTLNFYSTEELGKEPYYNFKMSYNATVTAKSYYNDSDIFSFSALFENQGNTKVCYTNTGVISTNMDETIMDLYKFNITIFNVSEHFNNTYYAYNFSEHDNFLTTYVNRTYLYADVTTALGSHLNYNVTVNGIITYFNVDRFEKIYCYGNNCTLEFESGDYISETLYNRNTTYNLTVPLTYAINRLYFKSNGTSINDAMIIINYPSGYRINRTTDVTGMINFSSIPFGIVENGTYLFEFLGIDGYVSPVNFSESTLLYVMPFNITYNLSVSRIIIKAYMMNGSELHANISISANGLSHSFTGMTNSDGEYNKSGIYSDYYNFIFSTSGYNSATYYINFSNRAIVNLDVYLLSINTSSEKTFYTKDSVLLTPIQNTLITFTKQFNLSYVTIGQILTDGIGFGAINLEDNVKYVLLIEAPSFDTKTMTINTIGSISSYSILLQPANSLNFTEFYDLFSWYITKTDGELYHDLENFSLITSSSGSSLNWYAVQYDSTNKVNITGSPAGGVATLPLDTSLLPEYFKLNYLINIDNQDTFNYTIAYHRRQSIYNNTFVDAASSNPITTNRNKGVIVGLLVAIFLLMISQLFPIDRADGTKSMNAIGISVLIALFMFMGWVNVLIGVLVMFMEIFTILPKDN